MRSFETVRGVYRVLYTVIWVIALLAILGSLATWFLDDTGSSPLLTVIGISAGVAVTALVLSWLLLITICAIDSRNFLADMRQFQIDRLEQSMKPEQPQGDIYERRI